MTVFFLALMLGCASAQLQESDVMHFSVGPGSSNLPTLMINSDGRALGTIAIEKNKVGEYELFFLTSPTGWLTGVDPRIMVTPDSRKAQSLSRTFITKA